jgi:hypothetical protein
MGWSLFNKQQDKRRPNLMAGQDEYVFRRSRTLTGTTSEEVTASAESRGQLKTDRLKLHQLRQYRLKILKFAGGVACIIGVVAFLASVYISKVPIDIVQSSSKTPSTTVYSQTVQDYFGTRPLERFGFIANPEALQDYLKQHHTELKQVAVEKNWYGGDFRLGLYFREPLLTWTSAGQKYYVDNQGYAFSYNHFTEPEVVVTDESGISPDDVGGGLVASERFVSFLGRMVGALNSYGKGKVETVTLPASTREIDIKLQGRATRIRTHIDRDPLKQAEDVANALAYFDSKSSSPEYIDVRVAGKAFYR